MACVLVIDDAPQVHTVLRRMLDVADHEVVEARDGHEGLRWRQECPIAMVASPVGTRGCRRNVG